jgi:hypothetical protein
VPGSLCAYLLATVLSLVLLESLLWVSDLVVPPSVSRELRWREKHKSDVPVVTQKRLMLDRYSPQLGWELKPNVRSEDLTSNSMGLRGRREYDLEQPLDSRRILCVGDSFIFGQNLTDEQTMPTQLETILDRHGNWEVLNLGVHGYGTDQQWLRLEGLGFQYSADVVVLGFFEENIRRNVLSFRDYAKPYFELENAKLVIRNSPVPSPEELLSREVKWPSCTLRILCVLEHAFTELILQTPHLPPLELTRAAQVTLALLDTMRTASINRGMLFIVMNIPRRLYSEPTKVETLIRRWAERSGTPFINLREKFLQLPKDDQQRLYSGHWTPYGAKMAAKEVASAILDIMGERNRQARLTYTAEGDI